MKILIYRLAKRCLVCLLAIILAIPIISVPIVAHAASFSDLNGNWAEAYINTAISKGFATGYSDGTFRPDKPVTRAEFTSMINKAVGNTGTTTISFTDVPSSEWYYKEVAKGMSAEFVGGYDDNTFRPDNPVSRQEAAVMLSRIIPTYGSSASLTSYSDYSSVSDWATSSMSKVCGKGYMGAYKDGDLHPLDHLTRAQTCKILCDMVDSETISAGTTTVRTSGTTLSDRVYANDVILHADLGDGEAALSNCIVLGTLYVYGGGKNTVTIKNSRIANAVVEKTSSGVRLLAQGEAVVANATVGNTAILETSGLSGGLYGTGFNRVNIKASADATLKGSFVRVNVIGSSANLDLESGTISTLNIESGAKSSTSTVASGATVTTANVNAAAAFKGSGTITTMNANTSGITYETKPKTVKSSSSSNTSAGTTTSSSNITITPKNGATSVDVDDTIVLTFSSAVTKYNGTALTSSNIDDVIELHEKTSSGTEADFTATINSAKKIITITPEDDLDDDKKYYVTIDKSALKIGDVGNSAFSSYFTTGDDSGGSSTMDGITISPKKGATDIDVDTTIKLTFDDAVTKYNGSTLTSSNLTSLIELHKKTASGTEVDFDATINSSKKIITITPEDDLDEDTKYYVTIDKDAFKFDGDGNEDFSSYFTTDDDSSGSSTIDGITISPKNKATKVDVDDTIKLTFDSAVTKYNGNALTSSNLDDLIELHKKTASGTEVDFDATINSSKKTITITPEDDLAEDTKYYVTIDKDSLKFGGDGNKEFSSYFTTEDDDDDDDSDVTFSPSNGATGISTSINPTISFSSAIETYAGKSISSSYLKSSAITFCEGSSSGTKVAFSASINSSNKKITIDPDSALTQGKTYYLAVVTKKLRTQSGEENIAGSSVTWTITGGSSVDTSSISTAINTATSAKSGVKTSADGTDVFTGVYWVTSAQMTALESAISTANTAKVTVTSKEQADAAANALTSAINTFSSAKREGSKLRVDYSALTNAISDAKLAKNGISISADGFDISPSNKWVPQSAVDTLNSAISSAEAVTATIDSASQVISYTTSLNTAVKVFEAAISSGNMSDKTSLASTISSANNKIKNVRIQSSASEVAVGTTWVTDSEYKAFTDVISAATVVYQKRNALQSEVDKAVSDLTTAINSFTPKDGTK